MAVLSIRDVPDAAHAAWKMAALKSGLTLREWVIGVLLKSAMGAVSDEKFKTTPIVKVLADAVATKAVPMTPDEGRRIIAEAQGRLEVRKGAELSGTAHPVRVGEILKTVDSGPQERLIAAFRVKYNREPGSPEEIEGFRKRGW